MNYLNISYRRPALTIVFGLAVCLAHNGWGIHCQQQQQQEQLQQPYAIGAQNAADQLSFPYYLQSPLVSENAQAQAQAQAAATVAQLAIEQQQQQANASSRQQLLNEDQLTQRSLIAGQARPKRPNMPQNYARLPPNVIGLGGARKLQMESAAVANVNLTLQQASEMAAANFVNSSKGGCIYEKRYFAKLDECLARKPYPTIGLPAFRNEDLLIKRGLSEKHGCLFILNSGLFKNYQIAKYSVDNDNQCLDGGKVGLSMSFSNVTLSYLWTLRCLNRADQLLDDATLDGKTLAEDDSIGGQSSTSNQAAGNVQGESQQQQGICVGSSQSFGFSSLQLTNIEAQVELAADIFKNWRITNVTVAMVSPSLSAAVAAGTSNNATPSSARSTSLGDLNEANEAPVLGTSIKDFVFESLDGDELNWRYLHLYQNWARNRMHANFLDQYKRFLWISLQRCLSESSERLPVKLMDVFNNQRLN